MANDRLLNALVNGEKPKRRPTSEKYAEINLKIEKYTTKLARNELAPFPFLEKVECCLMN